MAVFFGDGFDLYTALTDCGTYWDASFGGTVSIGLSATGRFAGSRAITNISVSTATPYITKTSGSNDAVHHISLAAQQTTTSGTNGCYINLYDGATAQCTIVFKNDGSIFLAAGGSNGTALATYTSAVATTNTWYQFEIEVVINNTTGSFKVRRNGNTVDDFSATGLNTRSSTNNYANKIGIGAAGANPIHFIDDFLWRSDTASVPWIGDVRCFTRMPAADSSVTWTKSGSVVPITAAAFSANGAPSATIAYYTPFISPCTGTIGTVSMTTAAANAGNCKCTVFASTTAFTSGGVPTSILGSATPLSNLPLGSNTFTFGTPVSVTQGTPYWVGIMWDTGTASSRPAAAAGTGASLSGTTYAAFPTANPAVNTSSQAAVACVVNITASFNAGLVADIQQDAATTYVYSSTNGQADLYTVVGIASTPTTIIGVTTRGYFQKSDAGTRNCTVQLKSGATTVQGTSTALPAGSWQWIARNDLVDPATSAAWTATAVNNTLIGPIVTV